MGSFLSVYGGRKDMWHATIEKLKIKLDMVDVRDKLKISYESLESEHKQIFLDIACLFIGTDVRLVIPMWKDVKFSPEVGIEILQLKSLIKIREDNTIWMHDQLRDLGRSTVEQEDKEPGCRSRLWHGEDAFDALVERQGTSKVEAISLKGYHFMKGQIRLDSDMFRNLPRIRVLELAGAGLYGNFELFYSQLRWLSWHRPSIYPPTNLILRNLIVLDLSGSLICDDWIGWSSIKLVWIDPSIVLLKNLILLNLRRCWGLKKLPDQLGSVESLVELLIDDTLVKELPISRGMKKLEVLSADGCRHLHEIPASVGSLVNLRRLSLSHSGVKELPKSIGQLTSLVELTLTGTDIRRLPDFVGDLHDLEVLMINETNVSCLPGNLGSLKKLKVLDASLSPLEATDYQIISDEILSLPSLRVLKFRRLKSLPAGLSTLSCLETLDFFEPDLQTLPELPSSLISLTVRLASALTSVNLANLVNLKELLLDRNWKLKELESVSSLRKLEKMALYTVKISTLPEEIGAVLCRLKDLDIRGCHRLKSLPILPSSLLVLRIRFCRALERLPDLSNLKNLSRLWVMQCRKLSEIEGLGNLLSLKDLNTNGCILMRLDGFERLDCLHNLKSLCINSCRSLTRLPGLPPSLKELSLGGCEQLSEIEGVAELESLQKLDISSCRSLMKLPNLSKLQRLKRFVMRDCESVTEIPGLEELSNLWDFDIFGCKALKLPIFQSSECNAPN
ncbi:hypothetical protein CRG98_044108 [Punica granatum]|uniref:Uncharacterized protein n=1 Tax=Punica granatum TaxID=22663 RepID=A0A2I0HUW4_PUNGR|nr:hypothetical protein CRG98_044108 [Punica granatum]